MASWHPWMQRSNTSHQPANALTQKSNLHPYFAWISWLHTWLFVKSPAQKNILKKRHCRISETLFEHHISHINVCWEEWCWVTGWLVNEWSTFSLSFIWRISFLGCWHWMELLVKTMLDIYKKKGFSLVYRACFTYLPTALRASRPVLCLANNCALTCNRKYSNLGLFPA